MDDVPAAGAETELDGGGVAHDPVPHRDRAGQLGEDVGPGVLVVTEVDPHALEAGALG